MLHHICETEYNLINEPRESTKGSQQKVEVLPINFNALYHADNITLTASKSLTWELVAYSTSVQISLSGLAIVNNKGDKWGK